jgi:RNA polymerase sigma-70 factor (ECF subfamily)
VIDLKRFWSGESDYLEEVVRIYGPLVFSVARIHSKDRDHTDDLYQDVWKRVIEKRETFSGSGRFEGWLRRVAYNVCLSDRRARNIQEEAMRCIKDQVPDEDLVQRVEDPLARVERRELQTRISLALASVSEREREAIELRIYEGRPAEEVARIMDVKSATVRSLIRNGIHRVRDLSEGF